MRDSAWEAGSGTGVRPSRAQSLDRPTLAASTIGQASTPYFGPWLAASELFVPTIPGGVLVAFLFGALTAAVVGFAFLTPSAQALISRRTSADRQGEILGVNQSASAMARILGPVLGLALYKATDSHLLPYAAGALLLVLMLPMLPRIKASDAK